MAALPSLLLATSSADKIRELRDILSDLPYRLVTPTELGVRLEVEESGTTFAENAALKARAYAAAAGCLALADDSGLEIDALGGEPGVYSARWAGDEVGYPARCRLLLERLADVPAERRTARYQCVITLAAPPPRGLIGQAVGTWEGRIADTPRGSGGFGYDPIFLLPELGQTVGELAPAEKHRRSHRAQAAIGIREVLGNLTAERAAADD